MQLNKTREDLVLSIKEDIKEIINKSDSIDKIIDHLESKHGILRGDVLSLINDSDNISNINIDELGLIGEQVALSLGSSEEWLYEFFTKIEIEDLRNYMRPKDYEQISYTFKPAVRVSHNVFYIKMTYEELAKSYDEGIFGWDEKVQREGEQKVYKDKVITIPKLNNKNVNEITEQALDGILLENELAYNLVLGSAPNNEPELYYNEKTFELTFNSNGFKGQIVDGMHRTVGIHKSWMRNKNIVGSMPVRISNYTTEEAIRYQVETAKATPIDVSRLQEMSKERLFDRVVDMLKVQGHLKGKISTTSNLTSGTIVSYKVLSDAFYDLLEKDGKYKIKDVIKSFPIYLMYLFESFEDEYLEDKDSIIFDNFIFYNHVQIYKSMLENNIPIENLEDIIDVNYFNKNYITTKFKKRNFNFNYLTTRKQVTSHFDEMVSNYIDKKEG
mgnify:CR=1 FL=1